MFSGNTVNVIVFNHFVNKGSLSFVYHTVVFMEAGYTNIACNAHVLRQNIRVIDLFWKKIKEFSQFLTVGENYGSKNEIICKKP